MSFLKRKWRKRVVAALGAAVWSVFSAFGATSSLFAEEPSAVVPSLLGGGPCVVGPNGELICDVDAAENGAKTDANETGAESATPKVDLATRPWLVESINLPPNHPALKRDRMIWANSFLWTAIEDVVDAIPVEKWATAPPKPEDFVGKYVLVEMWATWCPPCRRSLPYLDFVAQKYKDDLVVVSICETDEEAIRNMPGGRLKLEETNYFVAIDTGRRLANKLGVYGIPHVILLEPSVGGVVWEGMPTAPRYELDDKTLERFFAIGRKLKKAGNLPEISPIRFDVSEPTEEERASRRNVKMEGGAETIKDAVGNPSL